MCLEDQLSISFLMCRLPPLFCKTRQTIYNPLNSKKLGRVAAAMAKVGFRAQNAHLRHSSIHPPYFSFCRSCTQLYSSSSSRVFYRLEVKVPQIAKGLVSSGAANVDALELKLQSNYSTFQQNDRKMQYPQTHRFPYWYKDPYRDRESEEQEEDGVGALRLGNTADEWDRATEDLEKLKTLYGKSNALVDIGASSENDVAEKADSWKRNIDERNGGGLSMQLKEYNRNDLQQGFLSSHQSLDQAEHNMLVIKNMADSITLERPLTIKGPYPDELVKEERQGLKTSKDYDFDRESVCESVSDNLASSRGTDLQERLGQVYNKVLVVDNIPAAKKVVSLLTNKYRNLIHACDTEVANIKVKEETPVNHGEIICFSIYSGPDADFGEGKSCIWVDVLDGGGNDLLDEFVPFFEDQLIKKVWHNYSFDNHIIENYGVKLSGFYADTMHMARLWNSSRRMEGGYSLEALSGDSEIMSEAKRNPGDYVVGKVSMKTIFGKKKLKKDGSEGKLITIPSVTELQQNERKLWICYSALDSISTLMLYESLERKLKKEPWCVDGHYKGSMFNFYQEYVRPFGELLVKMETEGMQVNRSHLAEIEKLAKAEQQVAADRFRKWASKYCPDAMHMNVGSDIQLRQFFFGGVQNRKDQNEFLPVKKEFSIPNVDNIIEEGKKKPSKTRKIVLYKPDGVNIVTDNFTASGWPSLAGGALKNFAGKVSADFDFLDEDNADNDICPSSDIDTSAYGAAYTAFGGGQEGIEACHAIAALCEVCSIDSLISNFILPLQGGHISGKDGRIHCSLNINTETGRLSARRPNLQNQPALEKDRYKIRKAFIAETGNSLVVADYGQLELRILAHLANCKSMLEAFEAGGDFHSRTAMNMYPHIRDAVENGEVLLEWNPQPGEEKPPVPLLKDAFASERRKAKMLNFSIAYGKTSIGLARDWKVSREEAQETVDRWYSDRQEVLSWQRDRKNEAKKFGRVYTLLGRARHFPSVNNATYAHKSHIERAAINTPVQGSAADVAMCAMLEISKNARLQELGWKLILQVHDEVILEGPTESAEEAKAIVVDCMSKPFNGKNFLRVDLSVDAKCAQNWYSAK